MYIKFKEIKDVGDFMKERIIFSVEEACDLGQYLIAHSRIISDSVFSSKVQNLYWFPDNSVAPGDLIVVYTKRGENSVTVNEDDSKTYFFYWGLEQSLSTTDKNCIVLFNSSWKVIDVPMSPISE